MSSPTPAPNSRSAPAERTSLTERRKAATRMEIARAAARLFVGQGLRATRAEDIARAAGIAPRTFYRYFASKEEAVAPLYAAGAQRWKEAVAAAPGGLPLPQVLEHAARHTLTPGAGVSAASWELVRTLIRLTDTSPALGKVWAEVCREAEAELAEVLADRVADEEPGNAGGKGPDNVGREAAGTGASAALRFAAAVAGAAVRVAVETWAAGTAPASGPQGPATLALRNLAALREFPWTELAGR
ncbi:TetR/AcrR family transcriptional regulator [Streptomyces sediminimaris]|uniref:TetR/AcrR family transcriptional regulator n=1 Tax=Streptomyces sediminimaris TaxID=3383721 RepID=UPI00399B983A